MAMKDARALLEFKMVYGSARNHEADSVRLLAKFEQTQAEDETSRALPNIRQDRQLTQGHIKRCIEEYTTIKKHKAVKAAIAEGGEAKEWADYLDALAKRASK